VILRTGKHTAYVVSRTLKKCWVVSIQIWVKNGQTQMLVNVISNFTQLQLSYIYNCILTQHLGQIWTNVGLKMQL